MNMEVIVNLHLKNRCIETEARSEFNRLMETYFKTDDLEGELDDKIELLRDFLDGSDFRKLRSSDIRLTGTTESDVIIKRNNKAGAIVLEVF